MKFVRLLACCLFCLCVSLAVGQDGEPTRATRGLLTLYDFSDTEGKVVKDRSGAGDPIDLVIADPNAVRRGAGTLEVRGDTRIESQSPATKLIAAVRRSKAITIEAWIRTAALNQDGPARIVTLSRNSTQRNFTVGQDGDALAARLRTTKTSGNGIPALESRKGVVTTQQTHVVYSRSPDGKARLYVNGKQVQQRTVAGDMKNWDNGFRLALANELDGGRPWRGTFYLVAVYGRALSNNEVAGNFAVGPRSQIDPEVLAARRHRRLFEQQVAPLLSHHCLECHDAATNKGGLNLARRDAAFAGGESGKAIVGGKAAESLLWELVESDDMPKDRDPLSTEEKATLRQWLEVGAPWTLDAIDPAIYAHAEGAGKTFVQRLTVPEYIETVRSAVGVDIAKEARELLPPDLRADGFSNTAYNLNVDLKHIDAYARLAEIIVGRMDVLKFARRFSKSRSLSTDATMRDFVADMGRWLLRGPLDDREVSNFSGVATTVASAGGNYEEAVRLTIEAMLQSPRFIYRVESQRGDGSAWPVSDYELASRLSYILWGGPPDQQLLDAAEKSQLDRSGLKTHVKRMLADPRAIRRSKQFLIEWLDLDRLANLRPNEERFPDWQPQLAQDMRDETLAFFVEVAWKQRRPLADLLNAQTTFVTPELAAHYGLPAPADSGESRQYDLSDVPGRGGLLTQGSILTVGGDEASMVTRGLFVMHSLLRGTVKDPPPCVDTRPVPTKAGLTQRGIAEARMANVACGGCHAKFEPLAFGLEKFDGLGSYLQRDEHDNPLREDGTILFPGAAKPIKYESSRQLMDLLAGSERVQESLTWKVTQFALGRPLVASDAAEVAKIHQQSQDGGGTYPALLTAIVTSDLVRMTKTERDQ